jgi:Flp pilus assembly protein TadG
MIAITPRFFRRRGATVVETAVVLMIVLIFIFAIFEYGRYVMISDLVNNAAREGARQAVATTNTQDTASIQNTVIYYLANQQILNSAGNPLQASDVQVYQANPATGAPATPDSTWYNAAFGSSIVVQVTVLYTPMFPTFGFLPNSFQIQGTSMMASEAN